MIDNFLAIIDRLIQLREYDNKRLSKLFTEVFEPVFDELLLVHRNYMHMFDETYNSLPDVSKDKPLPDTCISQLKEVSNRLRTLRLEFEPVRVKLRLLTEAMQSLTLPPDANTFVQAVQHYFTTGTIHSDNGPLSPSITFNIGSRVVPLALDTSFISGSSALLDLLETLYGDLSDAEPTLVRLRYSASRSFVAELMASHRSKWSHVCETYAALKIAVSKKP